MIKEYQRYLGEQMIGAALVNFVFNAGLAWLAFRASKVSPLISGERAAA